MPKKMHDVKAGSKRAKPQPKEAEEAIAKIPVEREVIENAPTVPRKKRINENEFFDHFQKNREEKQSSGSGSSYHGDDDNGFDDYSDGRFGVWKIGITVVAIIAFLFYAFSVGAVVEVEPRQEKVSLEKVELTATKGTEATGLPYELMVFTESDSMNVPADGVERVERKASGPLTIFNNSSEKSQILIKNTRFESPEGKIYRIDKSVTVPGMSGSKAGSIEVTVYADDIGESYNTKGDRTKFTIPGFKGSPLFDEFHAELSGSLSGGRAGLVKVVSKADLDRANKELETKIQARLLEGAEGRVPEGFELFDESGFIEFTEEVDNKAVDEADTVMITKTGTFRGVIFEKTSLASHIARLQVRGFEERDNVESLGWELVIFAFKDKESVNLKEDQKISFTLNGDVPLQWVVDETKLKETLAGIKKAEFEGILSAWTNIDKAKAKVRPFWKRSFPADIEDIEVKKADLK